MRVEAAENIVREGAGDRALSASAARAGKSAADAAGRRIRVATYNIRKAVGLDWKRRPDRILAVLGEIDADVVAIQEADKRFGSRASTLSDEALAGAGWRAAHLPFRPKSIGWHGNAVLVRPTVEIEAARGVDLPAFEPRGAAIADVSIAGQPLRVVAMHLGLTGGPRMRQVAAILDEIERDHPRPTVIMGDTNEWRALTGCLSRFETTHHISPPMPTFHTSLPVAALDRIVTTRDLLIEECRVHASPAARRASDHLPLVAELSLADDA
jgi:endonuclease/exonuclease/phosphatase family metal-dependent hydrolase